MAVVICGTGKALPVRKMENADFPARLDTSDEWIRSHTGIASRFIADETDSASSLAVAACREAMGAVNAADIDLIVCATATPDYCGFPSVACLVQRALGAQNAACFDIAAACSGFLYALDTAAALMERHKSRFALVCAAEVLSRIVDWNDRATCVLFGDGAGAVLLQNTFTDGYPACGVGSRGRRSRQAVCRRRASYPHGRARGLHLCRKNHRRHGAAAARKRRLAHGRHRLGGLPSGEQTDFGSCRKTAELRFCQIRVQFGNLRQYIGGVRSDNA